MVNPHTTEELVELGIAESLGDSTDNAGNVWKTVRMKASGATISEMVLNKERHEFLKAVEAANASALEARRLQDEHDAAEIDSSPLPSSIKELLKKRLRLG